MTLSLHHVAVDAFTEIHQLPDTWTADECRALLALAEYDDPVGDDEAEDMAIMVLQDLDGRDACDLVLSCVFGDDMSSGVRQNLIDDLGDDRPWELIADVDKQARLFTAIVMLQRAFPTRFGTPDAVRLRLSVQPGDEEMRACLQQGSPGRALLLRLLSAGMDDDAVLCRLYEDEMAGTHWPDADSILWRVDTQSGSDAGESTFDIYSSLQWLGPLQGRAAWDARGWPDEPSPTSGIDP